MREPLDRPARDWAAELVDAWIDGQPTAPIIGRIPPRQIELATTLARVTCERLRHFARRAESDGIEVVPAPSASRDPMALRRQVERLLERQKKQRREG